MKHNFTRAFTIILFFTLGVSSSISSQIVYNENFESVVISPTPPLVGPLPAGMAQYNVDGHTPNAAVNFMTTNAWVVRYASGSKVATSNSWYTPVATSDDWLVTPAITMPASGNARLKYRCKSQDPAFLETYQIWVTTTGNTVADFTANGTMLFTEAAPPTYWTNRLIDLSAYLGQTIYIAFRDTSNDKYLMNVDDISVGSFPNKDVTINYLDLPLYQTTTGSDSLNITFYNSGIDTVTSLTIDWNDGTSHIGNISGLNIPPFTYSSLMHPTPVSNSIVGEYPIAVNITLVNGGLDENPADNVDSVLYHIVSSAVQHNVLVENMASTTADFSVQGDVTMDYLEASHPSQFIGVTCHIADTMEESSYALQSNWGGVPSCNVDRYYMGNSTDTMYADMAFNLCANLIQPASLSLSNTWDYATRNVSIDVTAHFVTPFSAANFALSVIVVEDGVTGTDASFNQVNLYAGGANGVMGGYELLPNPVPAAQMTYNRVARAIIGGYNGFIGSIPGTIADLQNVNYNFNYTLPAEYDESNIKLIAVLIDRNHGMFSGPPMDTLMVGWCANAAQIDMNFNIGIDDQSKLQMNLYPNPASDMTNVQLDLIQAEDINLYVYDLSGKQVYEHKYGILSGTQYLTIPLSELAKGKYIVSVSTPTKSYSKQLLVK